VICEVVSWSVFKSMTSSQMILVGYVKSFHSSAQTCVLVGECAIMWTCFTFHLSSHAGAQGLRTSCVSGKTAVFTLPSQHLTLQYKLQCSTPGIDYV